jgi:hypothetical protein
MPKENIRARDYNFVPLPEGIDAADATWDPAMRLGQLSVGWRKGGEYVEVATVDDAWLHALIDGVRKAVAQKGDPEQVVRDFFAGNGIWVVLSRSGCNDAIATLRRARDGAYGRDQ